MNSKNMKKCEVDTIIIAIVVIFLQKVFVIEI